MKEQQALLSIVTPVFNSKFLLRALWENLDDQGYEALDWVLVNDGSTDEETLKILKEIEQTCDYAQVFHQENGGAPKARNFGFTKIKGDFVKFLDADDLLAGNHLLAMAQQCDVACPDQLLIAPQRIMHDYGDQKSESDVELLEETYFEESIKNSLYRFSFHHSGCFFHRELAGKNAWDESLKAFQDLDFLWQTMLLNPTFTLVNDTYFVNREHHYTNRITTQKSPQKWLSRIKAVKRLNDSLEAAGNPMKAAVAYRFNTLFLMAFFEDRQSAQKILSEKKIEMGHKFDTNLFWRIFKEIIKKIVRR